MIKERFSLEGKVALVTGGGRGIGRSIAVALAEFGADVAIAARTTAQVEQVAGEIRELSRRALPLTVDISKIDDLERMVKDTVAAFGRIDVLVNNAAISPFYTRAEKITPEMWDQLMSVDLRGFFFCTTAVAKVMMEQKGGSIVNVSSNAGFHGSPRLSAYSAAKAGVLMLTKTLAAEWVQFGIRVNAIAPGWCATDFTAGLRQNPALLEVMLQKVPMKRVSEPEEIAGAAVFLASDASSYMTGEAILMEGGAGLGH